MKKNSFVEGTIIATLAIVFTKILGMLYVIPFYAIIGEQGSSLYSYAYNIYLIFLSISSAGIPVAMSKIVSEYESKNMKIFELVSVEELENLIENADLIITHGGVGSITLSLKKGKKVIAIPRLHEYHEHVNDHQKVIVETFNEKG